MNLKEAVKKYNEMFGPVPYEIVKGMDDDEKAKAISAAVEKGVELCHDDPDDVII